MVTMRAARVLHLNRGEGEIRARRHCRCSCRARSRPEPAPKRCRSSARPWSFSEAAFNWSPSDLAARIDPLLTRHLQRIELVGRGTWLVNVNVSALRSATEAVLGPNFQIAGKPVRT